MQVIPAAAVDRYRSYLKNRADAGNAFASANVMARSLDMV